jgi:tetratricopeptide (TPR) repeat protein
VLSATNLAGAELQLATPQARAASASRILELHVRLYGEHHPKTADARMTLGETLMALGKADDAIAALRIAIADLVASNGPDDAGVADARTRLAGALQMLGRLDDATTENERALEIRRKRFPPGHPFIVESLVQRGRLQGASGKHADALATLADARDKLVANHGSDLELADVEKDLGYESGQLGKLADAEARYRHALALEEAALGKDSPVLAGGLRQLGTVLVRAKRNRDAIAVLERSLAIEIRGEGDPVDLADVRMQLALALEGDQKRALELATLALDTYTKLKLAEPRAEAAALVTKLSTKR